jgi:NAD+ kinase
MSSSPSAGALDGLLNPGKSSAGSATVAPAPQLSSSGGAALSFGSAAQQTLDADAAPTGARAARPAFTPGASSVFGVPGGAEATPAAMASPCFVHSHLDSAVGAARKQQQAAQHQHTPPSPRGTHAQHRRRSRPPPSDKAGPAAAAAAGYFGTEHAERSHVPKSSTAAESEEDAGSPSSSGTEDGRRQKEKRRPRSHRRDPSHRGPRGAAAPESGDEEHSHSSDEQGSSDGSYTVSGSGSSYDEEGDSEDDRVRSLTRQLAETAVGVREMSKQLGEWCSVAERRRRCHAGLAS